MSYQEHALTFQCEGEALVGILAVPEDSAGQNPKRVSDTAVIMVVGGPQYRAGSHRQYTRLARAIAGAGHPVLRFDYRGMGDSGGAKRDFESVSDDVAAAITSTQTQLPAVRRFVLFGLCDGASAALLYLQDSGDARVRGLCLLNPWVRSETSLARTHIRHYYLQRLLQREFWDKLMRGGVAHRALRDFWHSLRQLRAPPALVTRPGAKQTTSFQQRMATAAAGFTGSILLVLSGNDYTARDFAGQAGTDRLWQRRLASPHTTRLDLESADHTISSWPAQHALQASLLVWLGKVASAA